MVQVIYKTTTSILHKILIYMSGVGNLSTFDYVKVRPKYPDSPSHNLGMNVAFIVTDILSWVAHFIISSLGRAGDRSQLLSHAYSYETERVKLCEK